MGWIFVAILLLVAGVGTSLAEAGFRSPESLVRNVYAYYGSGAPGYSKGLPHDVATAQKFFDPSLRTASTAPHTEPPAFFVSDPAHPLDRAPPRALRLSGSEHDLEAWRGLDLHPSQAIRQDLCRSHLRQSGSRRDAEFHPGE